MTASAFDVVTVPDFSGPAARRFEILTLYFLASWMEYGGRSRALPLHIACIGDAPESVRLLAERCEAEITSHSPEPQGGFANKLRGFEVHRRTDHVLLLDSDILVLSELDELADTLGPNCVAAAAANGPFPVSLEHWPRIYEMLDLPRPEHQVIPLNLELDTFKSVNFSDRKDFPPQYNGGVVYAPWRSGLGEVWRDHLNRILKISQSMMGGKARGSNQPSLATAIAFLQRRGIEFKLLPAPYNARWQHLATGVVESRDARILHTLGFARQRRTKRWGEKTPWARLLRKLRLNAQSRYTTAVSAEKAMQEYHSVLLHLTQVVRSHRGPPSEAEQSVIDARMEDCHRLHERIKTLYEKYVRDLMP